MRSIPTWEGVVKDGWVVVQGKEEAEMGGGKALRVLMVVSLKYLDLSDGLDMCDTMDLR
jgi:hypothetical protein